MNRRGWIRSRLGVAVLGVAALGLGAGSLISAQESSQPAAQNTQAVRLSSVEGQVRIAQNNQLLADPALVNTPLFEGTQVLTSQDGRAELQFEDGSVVRLSPNSSLTLAALNRQGGSGNAEVVLDSGLGYFEMHNENAASEMRVCFGDSVVTASGLTVLRIDLDNPPGEVAVFSGNVHLERGAALAVDLHGGESVVLNGADPTQYSLNESIEPDSWDVWNSDRDAVLMSAEAARTGAANNMADRNNPAWNDLDANGNWYNVPDQGYVWSPNEAASPGWDPYGSGYWMWTPRYGYIWVSGASWGYLPYQCGAWNYFSDFGWGWAPGGCSPWWGSGIWVSNIGIAPGGYRPPVRPRPLPPHRPRPLASSQLNVGLLATPNAVVVVNRRLPGGTSGAPVRGGNSIVKIGGHVVQPLSAISSRPQYDHQNPGQIAHPQPVYSDAGTPGAQHPGFGVVSGSGRPGSAPVARPAGGAPVYSRPAPGAGSSASTSHVSSGGASSSHSSSGGGGGGASHGGGGGGGGSSHSSSSSSGGSSHR